MPRQSIANFPYAKYIGPGIPVSIIDFAAPATVSTLTVLLAFTDLETYSRLLFILNNTGANQAFLIIESSESGANPDSRKQVIPCPAGSECSLEVGPEQIRKLYRVSVQTTSPGFPITTVQWALVGTPR